MSSATLSWGSVPARARKPASAVARRRTDCKPRYTHEARIARATATASAFMLAATALYLAIEIPFAARLVGLLSTHADGHAVEEIERLGRFISGAALALALWGRLIPRWLFERRSHVAIAIRLAVVTALCIAGMMIGQRTLVDSIADSAPPEWRRAALQGAVLRDAAIPGTKADDGAAQALTGALPFLGLASADRFAALPSRDAVVRAYATGAFPALAAYRDSTVAPTLDRIRTAYRDYASASDRIAEAQAKAYPELERSWAELQDTIARRRLDVSNPNVRRKIVENLNSRGVFVMYDWHPYDRRGFFEAGLPSTVGIRSALTKAFGPNDIPVGLRSLDAFAAQPAVQATLRKSIGLAETGPAIRASMDAASIASTHYADARKRSGERLAATLSSKAPLSAEMSDAGRDAFRLAVAAAFGIVLSAIGAAVHLCKVAYYAGSLLPGARSTAPAICAAIAAALMIGIPLAKDRPAAPLPIAWAIGTHGLVSPIGHVLDGSPVLEATASFVRSLPSR